MKKAPRTVRLAVEQLESRYAPSSTQLWIDGDGDKVFFTASKGDLTGHISQPLPDPRGYFNVDLSDPSFNGANFSVAVTKVGTGDGKTIIGHISAGSNDLGTVAVKGDLGDIDVGSGSAMVQALKSLTVDSLGRFGQRGDGDNFAFCTGNVGTLVVKGDLIDTYFRVSGNLTSASIGGSLIGGGAGDGGEIYAAGNLGTVTIKHDIRGGDGAYSGSVGAGGNVTRVTVGGSVLGGVGNNSGAVYAAYLIDGRISTVTVGGSVVGGAGQYSGAIGGYIAGVGGNGVSLGTVLIGEDLVGGSAFASGIVFAHSGSLDNLTVKGSLVGGPFGSAAGLIAADALNGSGKGCTISIVGSIYGGSGVSSGQISCLQIDLLTVGGSVYGGNNFYSGGIFATGSIGKATITHDLRGGDGIYSGSVRAGVNIASVTVGGSVFGGKGDNSGDIAAAFTFDGRISNVTIAGSLVGGHGQLSGVIGGHSASALDVAHHVSLGTILIGRDIVGGSFTKAGAVIAYLGPLDRLTVKGSLVGGSAANAGYIEIDGHAGTISIIGSVYGGHSSECGKIYVGSGINVITIGGSLIGGSDIDSGYVEVFIGGIGLLNIHGDVRGGSGDSSGVVKVTGGITTKIIGGAIIAGTGPGSGAVIG